MSTQIDLLPLVCLTTGVQEDEDLNLALAFTLTGGAPINLSNIGFTLSIGGLESEPVTAAGAISGADDDILTFNVAAAAKTAWPTGIYPLSILAVDATGGEDDLISRDVLGASTIEIGAPALPVVSQLVAPGVAPTAIVAPVSSAVSPAAVLAALLSLSGSTLAPLAQALLAAIPGSIPATGQYYTDADGFVARSQ